VEFTKAADLLKAMAHPLRLQLLAEVAQQPCCVHDLVHATGASQPLVSQHLAVLRSANLLASQRRGREVTYTLIDSHISHIVSDAVEHASLEGQHHEHHLHDPR
jgi:ArsR family transcriptional regulator, zinc-responsive transcriptional repressor